MTVAYQVRYLYICLISTWDTSGWNRRKLGFLVNLLDIVSAVGLREFAVPSKYQLGGKGEGHPLAHALVPAALLEHFRLPVDERGM